MWLAVTQRGSVRATKGQPAFVPGEVPILLTLVIPDAFYRRPTVSATVTIPVSASVPLEVDADVQAGVVEAIRAATGMAVELTVVAPPGPAS